MASPPLCITDFAKLERPLELHVAFLACWEFQGKHAGRFPEPGNAADVATYLQIVQQMNASLGNILGSPDTTLLRSFASGCCAELSPMAAVFGGLAAQEALKACSGKFTPLHQYLFFDAMECLPDKPVPDEQLARRGCRYDDQIAVFGAAFQETMAVLSPFVVGAGALGCEVLKNLAMIGVGTQGLMTITDMDLIERSNLNRQFLFRNSDVGTSKSTCAAAAVRRMNCDAKIEALNTRVGSETEHVFTPEFWAAKDIVINALDNVPARQYVDSQCIFHHKPLLEQGTLGTKGNVQVILPHLTESYGSSVDPPEASIPLCTIKNFPHAIEHTIQWAREIFEEIFTSAADDANAYLSQSGFAVSLSQEVNKLDRIKVVAKSLVHERPNTFEDCVAWSRHKFEELFGNQIKQLLYNFPLDSRNSTGDLFWSLPKRSPTPVVFDSSDLTHLSFILSTATLRCEMYGLPTQSDPEAIRKILAGVKVAPFEPRQSVKIATTEKEEQENKETVIEGEDEVFKQVLALIPDVADFKGYTMSPIQFEKDDDQNMHIDFITAASNLRASNYKIEAADRNHTKVIAGKIIPAIATTTAVVTGLLCLELYKIANKKPLEHFKNGFINLALPFLAFSEPIGCEKKSVGSWTWSLWDRIDVDIGDAPLQDMIDFIEDKCKLEVTMVSYAAGDTTALLYTSFFPKKKRDLRLKTKMTELCVEVSKCELPNTNYLILNIGCDDEQGEEVEVPYVRYLLS